MRSESRREERTGLPPSVRGGLPGLLLALVVVAGAARAPADGFCPGGFPGGYGGGPGPVYSSSGYVDYRFGSGGSYNSPGFPMTSFGSSYAIQHPFFSENDFRQYQWREERRERSERLQAQRQAVHQQHEQERAQRRQYSYAPPAASPYTIALYGYDQRDFDEVVEATLAKNQKTAREEMPTKAPRPICGMTLLGMHDSYYYYTDGEFFVLRGDELDRVSAPVGAVVPELPSGAKARPVSGKTYYEYKDTFYVRAVLADQMVFKVVESPQPHASPASEPES